MNETLVTRHLLIHGRVQGVYYRHSMRQHALKLGIAGWVRNRFDGTVEAMVHGESGAVAAIIDWTWQGPNLAKVTDVQVEEAQGEFDGFGTLPDA